jgi:hypothetical protein
MPTWKMLLLATVLCWLPFQALADQQYSHDIVAEVWGHIHEYTDEYIVVTGKRYDYGQNVIIDTASLQPDRRGNVRVQLNAHGKAVVIFFYGIDMPEVFRRYRRW